MHALYLQYRAYRRAFARGVRARAYISFIYRSMPEDTKWDLSVWNPGSDPCYPSWLGKASSEQYSTSSSFLLRSAYNVPRPRAPRSILGPAVLHLHKRRSLFTRVITRWWLTASCAPSACLSVCCGWLLRAGVSLYNFCASQSSLSSLYQLVILVPPACDYTSLLIIFTRVLLSSFIVLSSNLNVS